MCAGYKLFVGERRPHRVFDSGPACVAGRFCHHERFEESLVDRRGHNSAIGHDVLQGEACGLAPVLAAQRLIDAEFHFGKNRNGRFREPNFLGLLRTQVAKTRTLKPVDAHRNNRRAGFVGNHGRAVVNFHQAPGNGEASFREDDERVSVFDRLNQVARAERLCGVDWVSFYEFQERLHPPGISHAGIDGIGRVRRQQCVHQCGIEQAHVVRRDDRLRASFGQVFETLHLEAEERLEQKRGDVFDAVIAPGSQDKNDRNEAEDAETGKDPVQRKSDGSRLKQCQGKSGNSHKGGVHDIASGDDARAPVNR